MMSSKIHISAGLALLLFAACGSGGGNGTDPTTDDECIDGNGPPVAVHGRVYYERLVLSPSGLGPGLEVRLARFVDVRVRLAGAGTCYGETSTDRDGAWSLTVRPPAGSRLEAWAYSRTTLDPDRHLVVHDDRPPARDAHSETNTFRHPSRTFVAGDTASVDVVVPYAPGADDRPSIGFGLLDVLVTCSETVRTSTGSPPPICHAYTQLGNNADIGTSYYNPEARALVFLGGAAGQLDQTDTDYFDDGVVAHEYLHFLEYTMAHTLTRYGRHAGEALEPGFAWSEGQATGFGCLLRASPDYIDTWGTASQGTLLRFSAENWSQSVRGIGGEETVAEIVWDLGDGIDGVPDLDLDVAQVPRQYLLEAFFSFDPTDDAPYIGLLLDRLVDAGHITAGDVDTLLAVPEDQEIDYPLVGDDVWPVPLAVPGSATGLVDATVPNPCRAYEASRWYVCEVASEGQLTFDLAITPTPPTSDDLNLYLLTVSGQEIDRSTQSGGGAEQIVATLAPGRYIVRVEARCGGSGARAAYTLTVRE